MIDLRSDTATRPTDPMRHAIATAEVGDEQLGEDPTVLALEERVAAVLGKESALFLPSGTMANVIAFFVHCSPGDEVILHRLSHPAYAEDGGPAVHSRVSLTLVDGPDGTFTESEIVRAAQPAGYRKPRTRMVAAENTNNRSGGAVWPVDRLTEVAAAARARGLATHLDGARLLNASVAGGVPPATIAAGFDSVWIDLSKGLGCPVGAVLAGSGAFIAEARWAKHLFGGALRQAGILAAAGLYALDHHVERMADDHALARDLAAQLTALPGVELAQSRVDTNIVQFDVGATGVDALKLIEQLARSGVMLGHIGGSVLRAVTHLDIKPEDIPVTVDAVERAVRDQGARPARGLSVG